MPRGGARPNSGPPPSWRHGRTKTIRVPRALAAQIKHLARQLDQGRLEYDTGSEIERDTSSILENDTGSKIAEAVEILTEALKLKSNAGGKIKVEIRKVLELLEAPKDIRKSRFSRRKMDDAVSR